MARNGSGTYSLYTPGNPVVTGTTISSTWANNTLNDIATALTNSIAKDGQTTPTANLPMGTFKLTGLGAGTASTDSVRLGQAQSEAYQWVSSVSGTNTITGSVSPALTAYAAGQTFKFVAAASNTGAVTINIDGLGAKSITKDGTTALATGDILINGLYQIVYDGTQFQLSNSSITFSGGTVTSDITMSGAMDKWAKGADVASATALPLITDGNYFDVTGTTTITSFNSVGVGTWIGLHFDGALTLTHDATDLILPGGANITTAAGDEALFVEYASGDYRCINYSRANGVPLKAFNIFVARDEKANNTSGGSSTSGSYQTRALNTVQQNNITGASLASNQVTLPAGTYYVDAVSPFFRVNAVKLKLVNVTDTADLIIGVSTSAAAVDSSPTDATLKGYFTLTGSKAIELQYRCATSLATNGLGIPCNFGDTEVYSSITFIKIT